MKESHLRILRLILSQPTAPFQEDAVVAVLADWAASRGLEFRRDAVGNVLIRCRRGRPGRRPHWLFAAHMDHPGFRATRRRGRKLWAEFRGHVLPEYFRDSRVRFFAPGGQVTGTIRSAVKVPGMEWRRCRIDLDAPADVPPGTLGVWNLPALRVRRRRLHARACDDLVGVAATLCALDEIVSAGAEANATALLTRGEEAAFIGALAACERRTLPADALIVAIETSKAQVQAKIGDGVVVRVGDKTRIFDPSLTGLVSDVARSLAEADDAFRYQRQLMPGGTCESAVYCTWGYTATGLCLPLGNYHNMGPGGRIRCEQVDLGDFSGLVKLLVALAGETRTPADADAALRRRFAALLSARGKYL